MGTKNCPGDFDCYANAEEDEPMFVLLARDASASDLVREWARRRMERKQLPEHDAKNLEALNCANAMERWMHDPDCPHCEGTGHRITTTEDDEFLVRCDCRRS